MRKSCRRKKLPLRTDTIALAALGSAYLPRPDIDVRLNILRPSFQATLAASATDKQFRDVLATYNVVLAITRMPGVLKGDLRDFVARLADDLQEIAAQRRAGAPFQVSPVAQESVAALLELYEQVLENTTFRILDNAERYVLQRLETRDNVTNLKGIEDDPVY